jgi:hypothetical protein
LKNDILTHIFLHNSYTRERKIKEKEEDEERKYYQTVPIFLDHFSYPFSYHILIFLDPNMMM